VSRTRGHKVRRYVGEKALLAEKAEKKARELPEDTIYFLKVREVRAGWRTTFEGQIIARTGVGVYPVVARSRHHATRDLASEAITRLAARRGIAAYDAKALRMRAYSDAGPDDPCVGCEKCVPGYYDSPDPEE
jgi:hypothetical protein